MTAVTEMRYEFEYCEYECIKSVQNGSSKKNHTAVEKMNVTAIQEIRWSEAGNHNNRKSVVLFSGNKEKSTSLKMIL